MDRSGGQVTMVKARESLLNFEKFKARLPQGAAWLSELRQSAASSFAQLGYPTTKLEDWKYTSVAPIASLSFEPADPLAEFPLEALRALPVWDLEASRLVFLNGRFREDLSSPPPDGVRVVNLERAMADDDPLLSQHLGRYANYRDQAFVALNTALFGDGLLVQIPNGLIVEKPLLLIFVASGRPGQAAALHPRNLIIAGSGSQAALLECYFGIGEGTYFTNAVTEIALGENAILDHYKVQGESRSAFHVATVQVCQGRSSAFYSRSICWGGALTRNDLNVVLDAEGTDCTLDGLYLASGSQHVDNHTMIDHAKPHSSSRELYKGILDGSSVGVFNGKIIVRRDAQKADAYQANRNLLLSDEAEINTKPQLEILADDVRCTHGATIGQIDHDALFYMRSRGIPREEARQLLIYAFANEVLGRIRDDSIRGRLEGILLEWRRR
jgi:Fe-S cluster assembly protein SufD